MRLADAGRPMCNPRGPALKPTLGLWTPYNGCYGDGHQLANLHVTLIGLRCTHTNPTAFEHGPTDNTFFLGSQWSNLTSPCMGRAHGYMRAGLAHAAPSNPPLTDTGYLRACRLGTYSIKLAIL